MKRLPTRLSAALDEFNLVLNGPKGKETIAIKEDYPYSELSRAIFSQFGLMHLVAPYLPRIISANFPVSKPVRRLIGAMYQSEGRKPPIFQVPKGNPQFFLKETDPNKAVVSYSAGKDSLWNMWWAQEKFGAENVLAAHINGLNRANASQERRYAERQQRELCFGNFAFINLYNGSRNRGYRVMRSRDIFLAAVTIPHALAFGASKIITEGFAETHPTEPFSGQAKNIRLFNKALQELGIPVEVLWRNRKEMDVMRDLFEHKPEWVPHVCNCFSVPRYHAHLRGYWGQHAPTLRLYDSQCGSCVKCRITNLGRILYSKETVEIKDEDIQAFLRNTGYWVKKNGVKLRDMIAGSFMRDFRRACKQYNVSID